MNAESRRQVKGEPRQRSTSGAIYKNGIKERQTERQRQRDKENSNSSSKTLILKDSSVRSIWTYLIAGPCYATNTNKHDYSTNKLLLARISN